MATSKSSVFRPDNINKRVYTDNYGTGGFIGTDKNPEEGGQGAGELGSTGCGGPPGGGAGGLWKANESRLGVVNGCKAADLCFGGIYIFDDAGTRWILASCSTEVGPVPVGSAPGAVTNGGIGTISTTSFLDDEVTGQTTAGKTIVKTGTKFILTPKAQIQTDRIYRALLTIIGNETGGFKTVSISVQIPNNPNINAETVV